ncbi:MAG: tRNA (N6-threonylcarbamoyladenosine(37)-N6)-methyltransferase TrmO [Deltaproteobacteria bacterium]|nr:tRNA (N6-threonylcarbamoyladenosine(37)-N6)-methyltransferase TrmO [Deltaproteobacteria bacterium]
MSDRWDHLTGECTFRPIGTVRSEMVRKFDAPHQPDHLSGETSRVVLHPSMEFDKALCDLVGFDYIWLVSWFHRNNTWKPKVRPPRGDEAKRGVFATRSPHRPNPIGLTAVRLLSISGLELTIGPCDLVDGTPILDIKPYVPAVDAFPDSSIGWLQEIEQEQAVPPRFSIEYSDACREQVEWLRSEGMTFLERAEEILKRDPSPHRTRRIRPYGPTLRRMGCGEWRVFFEVDGLVVRLVHVQPGYPKSYLTDPGEKTVPNREVQLRYFERWELLPEMRRSFLSR